MKSIYLPLTITTITIPAPVTTPPWVATAPIKFVGTSHGTAQDFRPVVKPSYRKPIVFTEVAYFTTDPK